MADTSRLRLRIFDGSRQLFSKPADFLAAHTILEIIPNGLTHTLTDPAEVYVLRWIAGRTAGIPEFAPLYTIT
jgi:hypothetical protein